MVKQKILNYLRALRLPFITASFFPFVFGYFSAQQKFHPLKFTLGLIIACATHLSANLINDYADSRSGADWQDRNVYPFFGGSKLIQEKVFSEKSYFLNALFFGSVAFFAAIILSLISGNFLSLGLYLAIVFLGWSYSAKPLQFSYCKLGEPVIFLLFGPALVMGGYFIASGVFPDAKSFILSLPFGFFTAAILFANEVPDFVQDKAAGKLTWVSLIGLTRSYILYALLQVCAFAAIITAVYLGYVNPVALFALFLVFPALKATVILKQSFREKDKMIVSSGITIKVHAFASLILILSVIK